MDAGISRRLTISPLPHRLVLIKINVLAAAFVGNEMLSRYHPGVFSVKSKTWSCCQNVKATSGCAESHWLGTNYYYIIIMHT